MQNARNRKFKDSIIQRSKHGCLFPVLFGIYFLCVDNLQMGYRLGGFCWVFVTEKTIAHNVVLT